MKKAAGVALLIVAATVGVVMFRSGARGERQQPGTPVAVESAAAPRAEAPPAQEARRAAIFQPVAPGSDVAARGLPMKRARRADLAFLSEIARLVNGPTPPEIEELVALAQSGADDDALRAAADRLLADQLAVKLVARRWIAARGGEKRPEMIPPRPANKQLVGGFERR